MGIIVCNVAVNRQPGETRGLKNPGALFIKRVQKHPKIDLTCDFIK